VTGGYLSADASTAGWYHLLVAWFAFLLRRAIAVLFTIFDVKSSAQKNA